MIDCTRVSSLHCADIISPMYDRINKLKVATVLASLSSRMTKFVSFYASPIVRRTCLSYIHALVIVSAPILAPSFRHWTFKKPSWKAFFRDNTPVSGSTPPNTTRPKSHRLSAVFFFFKHHFLKTFIEDNSKCCLEGTVIPIG